MKIEQKVNYILNQNPKLKKGIKRLYQEAMYTISPKIKSEGNIIRVSPDDLFHEYFFGYYDKSPWDASDRYMLCMRAKDTWSDVSPKESADILIIDTKKDNTDITRIRKIAETKTWNVQQGCMAQWLGPDYQSKIIYNDYQERKYVSIILNVVTGEERILPAPVYTVSSDGKTALTLDFSRLYNLRPGYGYYNVPESTKGIALPESVAIWKIDIENGKVTPLLTYQDFAKFQPRLEMTLPEAVHKVNHLMFCPNGKRFMVLYRWFCGTRKYTRLITCNIDGSEMYLLSDDDMVSHCCWKNNSTILAFANKKKSGAGYYLMKDKSGKYIHCWPQMNDDGHPSYSPDGKRIVTDTYPNHSRVASIKVMNGKKEQSNDVEIVAKVFAPFKYDNDTRCDLHPRWNRAGDTICIDSVFEGYRGLYTIHISLEKNSMQIKEYKGKGKNELIKNRIRFLLNYARRNWIKNGKKQKLLSVKLNNFKFHIQKKKRMVYDLNNNKKAIFNFQKIIGGQNIFYCDEYYMGNIHYGIANTIRKYANYNHSINCVVEHGVYFGSQIPYGEAENSGLNGILTFGRQRVAHLAKVATVPVVPIGPYIVYAQPVFSVNKIQEIKKRNGRTLLVFPSHSMDRVDSVFNTKELIDKIKSIEFKFHIDTTYICLFYKDILNGSSDEYIKAGFKVITGGYRNDPLFLRRLRTFIEISDITASNEVGTHIGYSIALEKPHILIKQKINFIASIQEDMEVVEGTLKDDALLEKAEIEEIFIDSGETISDKQREVVNKYWGLEYIRKEKELYKILSEFENAQV